MLQITIPKTEQFNEKTEEFIYSKEQSLQLEHSLVSISKWEAKWHKPFLDSKTKSNEETIDYIRCMTLTQNVDQDSYNHLDSKSIKQITEYINDSMTATWFSEDKNAKKGTNREVVTSELIYYWMIELNIPVEFQKWHLNRLITLIKVCNVKKSPPKKMSKREIANRNRALNESRKKAENTRG